MSVTRNEDRDNEVAEGMIAFTITEPFTPSALSDAVSASLGSRVMMTMEGTPSEASEDEPVTVWFSQDVGANVLTDALAGDAHFAGSLRAFAARQDNFAPSEVQEILHLLLAPYKEQTSP